MVLASKRVPPGSRYYPHEDAGLLLRHRRVLIVARGPGRFEMARSEIAARDRRRESPNQPRAEFHPIHYGGAAPEL
jgi:hypothetical protein